jgi:hypothetical protein
VWIKQGFASFVNLKAKVEQPDYTISDLSELTSVLSDNNNEAMIC